MSVTHVPFLHLHLRYSFSIIVWKYSGDVFFVLFFILWVLFRLFVCWFVFFFCFCFVILLFCLFVCFVFFLLCYIFVSVFFIVCFCFLFVFCLICLFVFCCFFHFNFIFQNIKITKYVQLEKQKNGIFFNVAFNEEFSIGNLPVVLLSVACDIGQSNVELYMEQFQISSCESQYNIFLKKSLKIPQR